MELQKSKTRKNRLKNVTTKRNSFDSRLILFPALTLVVMGLIIPFEQVNIVTRPRQDLGSELFLPTIIKAPTSKDYTQNKFWRFDEAAPAVQKFRTHFLSSLTSDFRFILDTLDEANGNVTKALNFYASNENKTYPKHHLWAEMNPSIAKLPDSYLTNQEWSQAFGGITPVYIASYRITKHMRCIPDRYKKAIMWNYDFYGWLGAKLWTDFLGVALLNSELDVIADISLSCGNLFRGVKDRQDYRFFNLRGGDGENEQLYLSTATHIVPIALTLAGIDKPPIPGYTKFLRPKEFSAVDKRHLFEVWHRKFATCNNRKGKNFLYFDETITTNGTEHFETRVAVWPTGTNEVIPVDLDGEKKCILEKHRNLTYLVDAKKHRTPQLKSSFQTMEKETLPSLEPSSIFKEDRGSACCIRVRRDEIAMDPSMSDFLQNQVNKNDETLLVALVHFVTQGPFRNYVSRFIAFLPHEPYTIVAKTGGFCFGPVTPEEDTLLPSEYHNFWAQSNIMKVGERVDGCSRIHFPMAMVEKVDDDQTVIISYGDMDCFSRIVEVKKADIVNMFKGNFSTRSS